MWHFPTPHHVRSGDLLVGVGAGALGAVVAVAFTYASHFERRLFHASFGTADQKEGMAAFVEKRKPAFRNR